MKKLNPLYTLKRWLFISLFFTGAATAFSQSTLEEYQKIAATNNPELGASFKNYHAALMQIDQDGALPDPTLLFGYFISPVETRVGPQFGRLSYTQLFPWFGTLKAKEAVASSRAETAYHDFVRTHNKLNYELEKVWNEFYVLEKSIGFMEQNISLVRSFRQMAKARSSSGRSSMVDVIRADMELKSLEEELNELHDKKAPLRSRFYALVNDTTLNAPEPDTLQHDTLPLSGELALFDSISARNPELQQILAKQEAQKNEVNVSKKMSHPNISLGLDYIITNPRSDMEMPNNGRDAIMPRIGVSIPLYQKKYSAMRQQAGIREDMIGDEYVDKKNKLLTEMEEVLQAYRKSKRNTILYNEQTELAQQALGIMTTSYTTGELDFEELLRMERKLLEYQLKLVQAQAERNNALANIKRLTGESATAIPPQK